MKNNTICRPCAEELNELVQEKIDKALWLICNYEPKNDVATGYDAKAIRKMLDMYVFVIDVGLCKEINMKINWAGKNELKDLMINIGHRRSYWAHNQSQDNGNEEDRTEYENWMKTIIKVPYPQSEIDWCLVYDSLKKEEQTLIGDLEGMVNAVADLVQSGKTDVSFWKRIIEKWYNSGAGRKAVIGQWKKFYIANNPHKKIDSPDWLLNGYVKKHLYSKINFYENSLKEKSQLNDQNIKILKLKKENLEKRIKEDLEQRQESRKTGYNGKIQYAEWYISRVREKISILCGSTLPPEVDSLLPSDAIEYIYDIMEEEMKKMAKKMADFQ